MGSKVERQGSLRAIVRASRRSGLAVAVVVLAALPLASHATDVPLPELEGSEARVQVAVRSRYEEVRAAPRDAEAWGADAIVLDAHRFVDTAIQA